MDIEIPVSFLSFWRACSPMGETRKHAIDHVVFDQDAGGKRRLVATNAKFLIVGYLPDAPRHALNPPGPESFAIPGVAFQNLDALLSEKSGGMVTIRGGEKEWEIDASASPGVYIRLRGKLSELPVLTAWRDLTDSPLPIGPMLPTATMMDPEWLVTLFQIMQRCGSAGDGYPMVTWGVRPGKPLPIDSVVVAHVYRQAEPPPYNRIATAYIAPLNWEAKNLEKPA